MTDIPALIARVRELDAAAMPGPWSYIAQPKSSEYLTSVFGADDTEVFYSTAEARRHEHANAALAAEYRTAAPALAAALEAAMAENERLREALVACDDALTCDPVFDGDHWCWRCDDAVDRNGGARKAARGVLEGTK